MAAEKNNIGIKSFLSVPQEIFEQIIGQKSLELHDLFQLLLTCKWINNCLNSNELWKVKLLQRYCTVQRQSAVHTTHVVVNISTTTTVFFFLTVGETLDNIFTNQNCQMIHRIVYPFVFIISFLKPYMF